TRPPSLGFHLH
ncbi:hypothetical protein D030_1271B, partial [Vibrio parahaemolyticus AQ3810]